MNDIKEKYESKLRNFILENYLFSDDQSALNNTDSFLESGMLDSMGILELINYLDEEFSIVVEPEEMIPSNLDSISNLLAFLERKTT